MLSDTPHALSLGVLVSMGCKQKWDESGFTLWDINGNIVPTEVRNHVPLLVSEPDCALPADSVPNPVVPEAVADAADANAIVLQVESTDSISKLRIAADSLEHLIGHKPFNKFCRACVEVKSKRSYARRTTPEHKAQQESEAKVFGDIISGDHIISVKDKV